MDEKLLLLKRHGCTVGLTDEEIRQMADDCELLQLETGDFLYRAGEPPKFLYLIVPRGKGTDIGEALDFVNRVIKRKCVIFLISDFCLPGDFEDSLDLIRPKLQITGRRHDLITMLVNDPRETELPDVGWITLEDAETGEQVIMNTADSWTRQAYANLADDRLQLFTRTVRSAGIDLLELSTDKPYLSPLMVFFSARRKRIAR